MLNKENLACFLIMLLMASSLILNGSSCGNNPIGVKVTTKVFTLSSSAFSDGGTIPSTYNYKLVNSKNSSVSIPLSWTNAPDGTASFAISMIDKSASNFVHWLIINIPYGTQSLSEGESPVVSSKGKELLCDAGVNQYSGPEMTDHTYEITIYALNASTINLSTKEAFTITKFTNALSQNAAVLGTATISGKSTVQSTQAVTLSGDVQPIFTNSCVNCHGASGGLALDSGMSYNYLVGQGGTGVASEVDTSMKRVKPSDSANSILYLKVSGTTKGTQMPPSGTLSSANIQKIKDWIDQGASNN